MGKKYEEGMVAADNRQEESTLPVKGNFKKIK